MPFDISQPYSVLANAGGWNGGGDSYVYLQDAVYYKPFPPYDEVTPDTAYVAPSAGVPGGGTTGQSLVKASDTDGDVEWATPAGGGDALVASPLSQFAATTSAQLASIMTNETGTGALVFATSPTLVTPALGTPASGALTNCTAVPAGQIVGVIPIANLATGTPDGTKFVRDDGTLVTPSGGGDVATDAIWDAAGDLAVGSGSNTAARLAIGSEGTFLGVVGGALAYATPSGSGDVVKVGTPVATRLGLWTGDGTLGDDANLSFNTTGDLLTVGAGSITRAGAHSLTFTTTGTTNVTFPTGGTVYTSGGSGADVAVTDGGTGRSTSTTAYGLIAAGTTATGAHQTLAAGATTEILVGGGASALPTWTTASGSGAPLRQTSPTITAPTISGISTSDGASVTTAAAMGALAIDVTKGLNTKSISTESTFTFSGTPATANTWFGMHVINTDTAPHILTFPSSFSQVTQAARTTCPIAASGQLYLLFRYDGSAYKVFGDSGFLNNYTATAAPGVTDDLDLGYGAGSIWLDATGNDTYICESAANGAAVWHGLSGSVADGSITLAKMADLAQDQFIVRTTASTGVPQTATVTAAARTVLDDATTGDMLTTLGAQPLDADLTTIAGLTATTDNFLQAKSSAWASRTVAQVRTDLQGTGGTTAEVGFRGMPVNSQSAAYELVLSDAGKCIYHPSADTTARVWTIPANASVAFAVGTTIMIDNDDGAGALTIAITTDTLVLVGTAGSTGSRTLAEGGRAFLYKVTATRWRISGTAELT